MSNYSISVDQGDPNYLYTINRPDDHQLDDVSFAPDEVTLKYLTVPPSTGSTDVVDSGIRYGSVTEDHDVTVIFLLDGNEVERLTWTFRRSGG